MVVPDGIVSVLTVIGWCACLCVSAQTVQYCNRRPAKCAPYVYSDNTAPMPHILGRK